MSQRTKYGHDRHRNVKNAPIYLTPQVVRGILGIGHPKRVVTLEVVDIPLADACPPSKIYPAGKATSRKRPSTSKPKLKIIKDQDKQASDTLAVDRLDVKPEHGVRSDSPSCPERGSDCVGGLPARETSKKPVEDRPVPVAEAAPEPLITAPVSVASQPDLPVHLPKNGSGPALPFTHTPDHKFVPKVFEELSAPATENDTRPFANGREACARCGILGDLGCRHQRPHEPWSGGQ